MARMTSDQAHRAMLLYLERQWARAPGLSLGDVLSDAQVLADGGSADPAALAEWRDCVAAVLAEDGAGAPARKRA